MKYMSTKKYGHEEGLSCCFRQWRATHSHCSMLHGYALSFTFVFGSDKLDRNGWVVDFGGLGRLKNYLHQMFDHTMLLAADDPMLESLRDAEWLKVARLVVIDRVGCEAFAEHAYHKAAGFIAEAYPHARVLLCEVHEHGSNSAIYRPENPEGISFSARYSQ